MPATSTPETLVEQYVAELREHLRGLPQDQAADIAREIRSHLLDKAEATGTVTEESVRQAIQGLGPPTALAGSYVTDNLMARAQQSRMPWTILRGIFHWATLSMKGVLALLACIAGYLFGGAFFVAALIKPFNPKTGLWLIESDHYSLVLGMTDKWPHGRELLGSKLIPIGLAVGGATILLTTYFGLWCIGRFRQARAAKRFGAPGV